MNRRRAILTNGLCLLIGGLLSACSRSSNQTVAQTVESVPLAAGCTRVTLTWPAGTPLETVAAAVGRADALEAIWRFDASGASVIAYAPGQARREPSVTRAESEPMTICLTSASVLTRPRSSGAAASAASQSAGTVAALPPDGVPSPPADSAKPAPSLPTPASGTPPTGADLRPAPPAATGSPQRASVAAPFGTLTPGSALPSEEQCAEAVPRSPWEPRAENYRANQTRGQQMGQPPLRGLDAARVTGNFTGTTDEIIQWGACKWGIDADIIRAMAVQESWWRQSGIGDGGTSYGLLQIKSTAHAGTYPWSLQSTAFNVDYVLAWLRGCYDGAYDYWLPAEARGDLWGCVGTWYSGVWKDYGSVYYTGLIQRRLGERMWLRADF